MSHGTTLASKIIHRNRDDTKNPKPSTLVGVMAKTYQIYHITSK